MLHERFFTFLLHYMELATTYSIFRILQLSHPHLCFLTHWLPDYIQTPRCKYRDLRSFWFGNNKCAKCYWRYSSQQRCAMEMALWVFIWKSLWVLFLGRQWQSLVSLWKITLATRSFSQQETLVLSCAWHIRFLSCMNGHSVVEMLQITPFY